MQIVWYLALGPVPRDTVQGPPERSTLTGRVYERVGILL